MVRTEDNNFLPQENEWKSMKRFRHLKRSSKDPYLRDFGVVPA